MSHKAWNSKGEMPYSFPRSSIKFQGHTGQNITDFDPNWAYPDYRMVAAFKSLWTVTPVWIQIWWWNDAQSLMLLRRGALLFLAATKQLYDWFSPSVCLSVRPSVTPFSRCSHHRIIMKFSEVITNDKSDFHAKGQGQRSKVKVTEVTTQLDRFRTVTPVWIHIWWWNDAYSLMMLRRGALLFLKVIRQISRSHGSKKRRIWPRLGVSGL